MRQWGIVGLMTGHEAHPEPHMYRTKKVRGWDPSSGRVRTGSGTVYELGEMWDPARYMGSASPAQCHFFGAAMQRP